MGHGPWMHDEAASAPRVLSDSVPAPGRTSWQTDAGDVGTRLRKGKGGGGCARAARASGFSQCRSAASPLSASGFREDKLAPRLCSSRAVLGFCFSTIGPWTTRTRTDSRALDVGLLPLRVCVWGGASSPPTPTQENHAPRTTRRQFPPPKHDAAREKGSRGPGELRAQRRPLSTLPAFGFSRAAPP
ncbi:hypothetical protein BC628DRAFT_666158 [Trametes gibbosa]|nr:hypothetical protein BC628DRAFT_666158 [Trametes gibbosa]